MLNLDFIKKQMEKLGLNQAALAKQIGVSSESVSKWLSNRTKPRANSLLKMALALNVKVKELSDFSSHQELEPVLEFRKRGNCVITPEYHESMVRNFRYLSKLQQYFANQIFFNGTIDNPTITYEFIQSMAIQFRKDGCGFQETASEIPVESLVNFVHKSGTFFVPVLWGDKEKANACHLYLPKSESRWIYINLDTHVCDFKFWLLHEIGHMLTPSLKRGSSESESFADNFAAAVLFPSTEASKAYHFLSEINKSQKLKHIQQLAAEVKTSPITVLKEVNKFAMWQSKETIDLKKELYPLVGHINKLQPSFSDLLFETPEPSAREYIEKASSYFKTPIFEMIGRYLQDTHKGSGIVSRLLNISKLEALEVFEELTKNASA